jgi:hypothetical protein
VVADGKLRLKYSKVVLNDAQQIANLTVGAVSQVVVQCGTNPKGGEPFLEVG